MEVAEGFFERSVHQKKANQNVSLVHVGMREWQQVDEDEESRESAKQEVAQPALGVKKKVAEGQKKRDPVPPVLLLLPIQKLLTTTHVCSSFLLRFYAKHAA